MMYFDDEEMHLEEERKDGKAYIIYPENQLKSTWDIFVTCILVFTCFMTPWNIVFDNDSSVMKIADNTIDFMFLIDLIMTFFTAFPDNDFETVDDYKKIATNYL